MDTELIQSNPAVMMGKPVVTGTRITVELILEKLSAGETIDELLEAHPRLTRDAVLAALGFAARSLSADVVYPTAAQREPAVPAPGNRDRPGRGRGTPGGHPRDGSTCAAR